MFPSSDEMPSPAMTSPSEVLSSSRSSGPRLGAVFRASITLLLPTRPHGACLSFGKTRVDELEVDEVAAEDRRDVRQRCRGEALRNLDHATPADGCSIFSLAIAVSRPKAQARRQTNLARDTERRLCPATSRVVKDRRPGTDISELFGRRFLSHTHIRRNCRNSTGWRGTRGGGRTILCR